MTSTLQLLYRYTPILFCVTVLLAGTTALYAAPVPSNDDCTSATVITIPGGGFGLGTFTSAQADLTQATVQTGETFAPAIFVAGLDKKSVWFKFSIATIRAVRVTLTQPGTTITAGDAGFAVYQTSNCLPTNADISTKLTPIVTFGNTYHPCVPTGDYLIQVSSNFNANGPVTIQVEISDQTGAAYDHPDQAYAFGSVGYYAHKIDFNTECQSIEDATEACNAFADPTAYNKSAWMTFKTPSYFDYIVLQLSSANGTYFPSNNGQATLRTFGYTLYKGDAVTTPIGSLVTVSGCDSVQTNGYYASYKIYKCSDLDTSTTYSIQFFIKRDFADDVRWGILVGGQGPTKAPKPILANVPSPTNALGNLAATPAGTLTTAYDVWGCNSRHNTTNCSPALPDTGIVYNGAEYNLSSFFTFTLTSTCAIYFNSYVTQCGPQPLVRVFKQGLTNNCSDLDTANIIGVFNYNGTIDCLQPGNYTVQVSGQEYTYPFNYFTTYTPTSNSEQCLSSNLGTGFRLDMTAYTRKASNKYSLITSGAFDSINVVAGVMQPLTENINYSSISDTMGCQNTLRPMDTTCSTVNNKVMYREFVIGDSGIVDFSNLSGVYYSPWRYRLYSGDANALASAQNVFAFPDKVSGLIPKTECMDWNTNCTNRTACVVPGTYTFATMGGDADVGRVDKPVFTFVRTRTMHNTPFAAQDLGSLWDTLGAAGGTKKSDIDAWGCDDNAVDINGYQPCTVGGLPATKAIYRQFYLNQPTLLKIENTSYWYCYGLAQGIKTLFYGKATDGLAGLTPVGGQWECFPYSAGTTAGCNLLPAGWYTVVSYNQGPNYDNTFRSLNLEGRYNSAVSYRDEYNITMTPTCPGPVFNRPYKASVNTGNQPHLIQLVNRVNNTAAYPRTDTTYILPTEHFNCTLDTPFTNHPIKACEADANRVAYYIFTTTQESFLQINAGGYYAALYDKDVRVDSLKFDTLTPVQACNNAAGYIQYCFFQPGTYTLVIFAKDANICQSVSPSIYIDKIGYSRFDHAQNAYDFGVVPPDSTWHNGKVGDVNPLNSSRAPSNDIFYCTTGASATDPTDPVCGTITLNPNVYNSGPNKPLYDAVFPTNLGVSRRNLWYTFVIAQPGYVTVKLEPKTPGREYQQKFTVYRSNVDGTLPFSTVASTGEIDSTAAQGLTAIATNLQNWYYCANLNNSVQFYRDPCTSVPTRYYILAENVYAEPYEPGGTLPNTQTEVSILVDSINLVLPKHDHYSQAGDIGTVGVGTFQGDIDNYSCATKDATDPFYYYGNDSRCQKTLWYKFTPTITGNVRYRININGTKYQDYWQVQLFKQIIPGDSTVNGLQVQGYHGAYGTDNSYWAETCVSPGTYYLMLTGCDQVNAYVNPEIELIEAVGDFCSRAVPAAINGAGAVTATVLVDCHTIGTDYGEFGPQLTCPQGAATTDYKSSWFRMDIGGTDTLDVTTFLVENTNAASSDIKYRLMTGDCGAMQEQSCVLDALTQNTYQCLVPGQSYYVQVFTPISKFNQAVTGTIDLKLSAIAHADTCAPLSNCLASANFTPLFDCTKDDSVKFVNYSTYGTSIQYKWYFGYNDQASTEVSPYFFYPALPTDSTYSIKLVVENTSCGKKDSVTKTLMVPGRPFIDFGNDIASCSVSPVTLVATSHTGAVYVWNDNSSNDSLTITNTGSNDYWVKIDYNGCISRDTVKIVISNITPKPIQNIILCTDPVSISASRGQGETYTWNTGATTASINVSIPGVYWADVKYFTCTYRDSFVVNNVSTAQPLGSDTTVCLPAGGYIVRATTAGAQSYLWQDGSVADTLKITSAGQYNVTINFGGCIVKDTVDITAHAAPVTQNTDTTICDGSSLTLPWGTVITIAGIYNDTLRHGTGCDSLIRKVTVTVTPKPNLGRDTTLCLAQNPFVLNGTVTGAISYEWQDGSTNNTFNVVQPGLYWVKVNFANCSSRDSITISGSAPPVTNSIDTSICDGLTITLPWGIIVNSNGSYRDTVASVLGCDSLIQIVNVTILPKPLLGNDNSGSICSGSIFDLTVPFQLNNLTPVWTIGSATVANPASVSTAGIYQLIATNAGGCSDTALFTLLYSPKPVIGNDSAVNICQGSLYNLGNVYPVTNLSSEWTIGGVVVANPAAVSTNGIYQLIAINNTGCADTALLTLSIIPKPVMGNDTSINICPGNSADLTVLYNTALLTPVWTFNNTTVINPAAVTAAGTYRLIAVNASGCSDTAFVTIGYYNRPAAGNDTTVNVCAGNRYNLTTLYNTTGLISNWTVNNTAVADPSAVSAAGIYQLIATNNAGCSDTALTTLNINPKPALSNDTAVSICNGNTFNLTAVYPAPGLTSSWTLNSVQVSNPSAVAVQGAYQLIATNAAGCKDTAIVTLTVNTKPSIGRDSAISICDGKTIDLTSFYNTAGLTAGWTKNNIAIANPPVINTGGVYQLIVTTGNGCSDTALVTVTTNPKPNLGIDRTVNICQGNTVDLTTIFTTGANTNNWTRSGITVNDPSVVSAAGVYQLISTTSFGCADTVLVTLAVVTNPVVITNNQGPMCSPQTFDLTAAAITAGSAANLTFTYWQDTLATLLYTTPAAATGGMYYIKGTDTDGCFTIKPVELVYYPLPVVNAGDDLAICDKDSAMLAATVTNITAPVTYEWSPVAGGGIRNPASASTIVAPAATQQYILTVTDGIGCDYKVSDSVIVTMQQPVKAFAGNDTIAPVGLPHQLQATGGTDYLWEPAGLLNDQHISSPLAVIYADSILFTVIVKDGAGCTGYDTVKVRTYDGITYYVPNAFSPNGDAKNDVFRPIPVGIVTTEYFRIFNRYGELLFETNQYLKGWDGTYKGIPQQVGNYVWALKGKGRNGKLVEMKGNVVLIR